VVDANHDNRGELLLQHRYDDQELDTGQANQTLEHLHSVWSRPVHIDTFLDGKPTRLSFDGEKHESNVL